MKKSKFTFCFLLLSFLLISTSASSQWINQSSSTTQDLNSIRFVNVNTGFIAGNSGVIRKTTNSGATWLSLTSGTNVNLRKIFMVNENTGYIAGYSGTILYTNNQGSTWTNQNAGTSNNFNSVYFVNIDTGFLVGNNGILRKTTNSGVNWFNMPTGTTQHLMDVKFLNVNTGFIIGHEATVRKTTDGGLNWTAISIPYTGHRILMSIDFANATTGVIVKNNDYWSREIFRTTDAGNSWYTMNLGSMHSLREVQFLNEQTGIIIGDEGDYFRTGNAGNTWVMLPTNTMQWLYSVCFVNQGMGWAVGTNGTILFTDQGGSIAPNPPTNLVAFPANGSSVFLAWFDNSDNEWGFKIERAEGTSGNFVEIGTVGTNTINYIDNSGIIYGNVYSYRVAAYNAAGLSNYTNVVTILLVDVNPVSNIIPHEFDLHNNYPNPFNPVTKIKFDVPKLSPVKIEVFNIKGEFVEDLLNSYMNPGQYEIIFNSTGLSSGIYYYRMTADNFAKTKNMVLLK